MVTGCQLPGLLAYWGNYTIGPIVDYISQDIFRILFFSSSDMCGLSADGVSSLEADWAICGKWNSTPIKVAGVWTKRHFLLFHKSCLLVASVVITYIEWCRNQPLQLWITGKKKQTTMHVRRVGNDIQSKYCITPVEPFWHGSSTYTPTAAVVHCATIDSTVSEVIFQY